MTRQRGAGSFTFRYQTSAPGRGAQSAPVQGGRYKPLFRMRIDHRYYDSDAGRCPDLRAYPSPACLKTLSALGMVFKAQETGFSVYFNESRTADLLAYLSADSAASAEGGAGGRGCWSRLTFLLEVRNPAFVDISDLPITTNPNTRNIYVCNRDAHRDGATARVCADDYVDAADLYPTVGAEVTLSVPWDTQRVDVVDISGAVVLSRHLVPTGQRGDVKVVLDLSGLPLDLYTIEVIAASGEVTSGAGGGTVVYSAGTPVPLCLLDVLLTRPEPGMGGVYPVPSPWDGGSITPEQVGGIDYTLPFQARATEWRYFVVSRTREGRLTGLRIDGAGADFTRQEAPVLLSNGALAVLFTSGRPIGLRRVPPQRFRLTGQREAADGSIQDIRVDCLPAAPATPVWPGASTTGGVSEMYVYV